MCCDPELVGIVFRVARDDKLAFVEHDSVPFHLVQNTSGFEIRRENCKCCEDHVEVSQAAWRRWARLAVKSARLEGVHFDMSVDLMPAIGQLNTPQGER